MMRQHQLIERVQRYNPGADEDLLNRAYVYAMKAHGAQTRASGDPYFTHPLEVAAILTDLKLDDATIAAAVLHDVIEDTAATREEIDRLFGPEIGRLVEGLTKLRRLDLVSKRAEQGENFRKLLLAVAEDVRVLLVKLADRLHNMRTLHFVPPTKRARIAQETLDIYAPLAGRMGMQGMRDELEDLAFRHLQPEAHAMILARLAEMKQGGAAQVERIVGEVRETMRAAGVEGDVHGRQKQPYSIWRKMDRKTLSLEKLSDIYGFRVLVGTVDDCYRALGAAHVAWPCVMGRFKDYVSTPKQNGYRSLHSTVVLPGNRRVELQIRTRRMHEIDEYGIAAHALYKDGGAADETGAYAWLRR
ncbi:MAG: HD domain-containing protein, partial [Hyphomicrobiales bacterium]|nr:HD domain-containing protein [Hyphomicrobiales bacterium]